MVCIHRLRPALVALALFGAALTLGFGVSRRANAAGPRSSLTDGARAFAAEHGLTAREVEAGPSFGPTTRLALPLRPELWPAVIDSFGLRYDRESKRYVGHLIFRQYKADMTVVAPEGLGLPGDRVLSASKAKVSFYSQAHSAAAIVYLSPDQADHVGRWLAARQSDSLFRKGNGCSDMMMNIEVEPSADGIHTVRRISDEEAASIDRRRATGGGARIPGSGVRMGVTVADHTGVRASKLGKYMMMKWRRSGNSNVQILLVPEATAKVDVLVKAGETLSTGATAHRHQTETVYRLADLNEMSLDQILGFEHVHGVDEGARRPIPEPLRAPLAALDTRVHEAETRLANALTERRGEPSLNAVDAAIGQLMETQQSAGRMAPRASELRVRLDQLIAVRNEVERSLQHPADNEAPALTALREALATAEAERRALRAGAGLEP